MFILKIIFYLFHLVIGFIIGAVTSSFLGNITGIIITIIYWIASYRWTFFKKKETVSKALKPHGIQTFESNTSEVTNDIEPSLEGFQIINSVKKAKTSLRSEQLTHDDLVEFNDIDELDDSIVNLSSDRKSNSFKESVEDNLTDFNLRSTTKNWFGRSKPQKKGQIRWVAPDEKITVRSYQAVNGGYFYLGKSTGYNSEPSSIDASLKINSDSPDYEGEYMGYWPSYGNISPKSRAAYIEWLAGDRSNPDSYIGYVFLYFYGIERRIIVDGEKGLVSTEEHIALMKELYRLKSIYEHNRSFNGYVSGLISQAWVLYHNDQQPDPELFIGNGRGFTSVFKYSLGKVVNKGMPIPSELALVWVKSHPDYYLRTPARRCHKEFDQLFKARYLKSFGDGLIVKPNKTRLTLDYYPANASLSRYEKKKLDLPDVSLLKTPVRKLIALADSCTQELNSYSLFLGRKESAKDSLVGLSLLPTDLVSSLEYPKFERLKKWMETQVRESEGLASVESFLELLEEEAPLKINKKEATILANLAEKAGFGIVPDIRFHHAKPDINGNIVLFSGGHGHDFTPSHGFNQIGTILRLGAMVAVIDGQTHLSEVETLKHFIDENKQLSSLEKTSLAAYLHWRLNSPISMVGLKARIETINEQEKATISHILVAVALADGRTHPSEIKQLEKLYTSLGLDKSMVITDIHHFSSSKVLPSISKQPSKESSTVKDKDTTTTSTAFTLNRELLKVYEEETEGAKSLLESVFVDEQEIEEVEEDSSLDIVSNTENTLTGLDEKHQALYEKLISKEEWLMDEVETFCSELNLMVDGAFEVINDWAFDQVDAPLIDDGSTVYIDLELVDEIASL